MSVLRRECSRRYCHARYLDAAPIIGMLATALRHKSRVCDDDERSTDALGILKYGITVAQGHEGDMFVRSSSIDNISFYLLAIC